jgi:hypothetical protein
MSSASARILPLAGRALRGLFWTILFVVLAAGGAGLVSAAWHAPGTPERAELTYPGDAALDARLDAATATLEDIADEVEVLADAAKAALADVSNTDVESLQESLERGGDAAATIEQRTRAARNALAGLPGDGPDAPVRYSNATLVRRSVVLTAIDAASGLALHWRAVAARVIETANLTTLLDRHDQTVLAAAADGRASRWQRAIDTLDLALGTVADVQTLRARLIAGEDGTVLDEWIKRNRDYDVALRALYRALRSSDGVVTARVEAASLDEQRARNLLPPDRRTIVVIVSEVTRGGLTEALVAIEDARARIDDALEQADGPVPSGSPAP